jgi:glycosyltransferase involved in cell wall biosynthesis
MTSALREQPLASCVMATTPFRRPFLSQALKYFSRQTYAPRELIVIDDPGEPAFELVRDIPDVRYLQTRERLTLGSKLNFGIRESRGSIIQNMDDDDYYHPEFLAATVGALLTGSGADAISACTNCLVLIAVTGELKVWNGLFAGSTLCFFKELWRQCPFRDISLGPDQQFLKDHSVMRIGIDNPELFIIVRHGTGHTWSRLAQSQQTKNGAVTAGDDVTEALRKLPNYSRTMKDCIPAEDMWFYEDQRIPLPPGQE